MVALDAGSRWFWVSFAAEEDGFRGAVVLEVSEEEVEAIKPELDLLFTNHDPVDGPWVAAASRKCWANDCNPGGEAWMIPMPPEEAARYPHMKLMDKAEIQRIQGESRTLGELVDDGVLSEDDL